MVGGDVGGALRSCPTPSGSRLYDVPVGLSGSDGFRGLLDPAGLLKKDDEAGFRDHRAAGIKHGRVAMMAELGGVAQHCIGFPGFDDGPVVSLPCHLLDLMASWRSSPRAS